jgi:hypothetical protein
VISVPDLATDGLFPAFHRTGMKMCVAVFFIDGSVFARSSCAFPAVRWRWNEVMVDVYFRALLRANREYTRACLADEPVARRKGGGGEE